MTGVQKMTQQITARKRTLAALQQELREEAEAYIRLLDTSDVESAAFFGSVAHLGTHATLMRKEMERLGDLEDRLDAITQQQVAAD